MSDEVLTRFAKYLEPVAKVAALIGGVLYISGFLIINAYLAKYGLSDYNVISSRFVYSGASFFLGCIVWWLFCGRLYFYKDLIKLAEGHNQFAIPGILLGASQISLLIARSVVASLAIYFFMFGSGVIALPGLTLIGGLMLIEAVISNASRKNKEPSIFAAVARLSLSCASIGLFYTMFRPRDEVMALFNLILSIEGVALPIGEAIKNNQFFDFKPFLSVVYFSLMIMTYMLSYGAQFYDKIYSKFGGGLSHEITLNTKDPINFGGLTSGAGNVLSGKLLYSNDKIFVVLVREQPITLAVDQIKASIIDIKPDKFNIYKMSKTVRRLGISWYVNPFENTTSKQKQVTPLNLWVDKPFHPDCYYDWSFHCNLMRDGLQVEK